jgi:hypothetical protein
VHSRTTRLRLHKGGLAPDPLPTAEQLKLGENNHRVPQARARAVLAAVRAGTYRGRDGRSHAFQARHQVVMAELCLAANQYGEVHPHVLNLAGLADELGRDHQNVCRDVRDLEAALLLWRRPVDDVYGRRFVYVIPGMAAPLSDRPRPSPGAGR